MGFLAVVGFCAIWLYSTTIDVAASPALVFVFQVFGAICLFYSVIA
ncbi:hypothetical protein KPL76_03700 [Subtercola sp. PAMC28395]|nr:hypothetical protein [Subtercola sp. PAMC28395]QWT24509.1 hypothetical protein KPL76_03700 [Subtercola sp. PAMC28395]